MQIGRPERSAATEFYFRYIDRIKEADVVSVLQAQLSDVPHSLRMITEEHSLHRYASGKWSIREVVGHMNDTERMMMGRAFWFARGFDTPLPSFDQQVCVSAARADAIAWEAHIEEFVATRQASIHFLRNLPSEAWMRRGTASGCPFTVRALVFLLAGHTDHHLAVVKEQYR